MAFIITVLLSLFVVAKWWTCDLDERIFQLPRDLWCL